MLLSPEGRFKLTLAINRYIQADYFLLRAKTKRGESKVEQIKRGKARELIKAIITEAEEMEMS